MHLSCVQTTHKLTTRVGRTCCSEVAGVGRLGVGETPAQMAVEQATHRLVGVHAEQDPAELVM